MAVSPWGKMEDEGGEKKKTTEKLNAIIKG